MADAYLTIGTIANDGYMQERMRAAATQQAHAGSVPSIEDPLTWVVDNRYLWASSPTWAEKWDYATNTHPDDPNYLPGRDSSVITDADILSTVQALGA